MSQGHNALPRPEIEPRLSDSEPSALTTGLLDKAVALACLWYSWPRMLKVAPCMVIHPNFFWLDGLLLFCIIMGLCFVSSLLREFGKCCLLIDIGRGDPGRGDNFFLTLGNYILEFSNTNNSTWNGMYLKKLWPSRNFLSCEKLTVWKIICFLVLRCFQLILSIAKHNSNLNPQSFWELSFKNWVSGDSHLTFEHYWQHVVWKLTPILFILLIFFFVAG